MTPQEPRVFLAHFTPPGVLGGVEHIMAQHARLLAERGWRVEIIAGRQDRSPFPVHVLPDIDAARPSNVRIERELAEGMVGADFEAARRRILDSLRDLVAPADRLVVHNAFTLHFSLPFTAALFELAATRPEDNTVAWCHDLSWTNPLYIPGMYRRFPWNLLRTPAPNTTYVTVSHERAHELKGLWDGGGPEIRVIPNGIDAESFLRLSEKTREIVRRYSLFDRDLVLLLPVRITRRKNIELGIRATRALADRGLDVRYLISGPLAPHHPELASTYLTELKQLRSDLELENEVVFLADELGENLDDRTVSELYAVADALLFPSAQEGFGLPILEAGLTRTPAIVSDIPIFREVSDGDDFTFDLAASPDRIAEVIVQATDTGPSRLFRRVRREYRWEALVDRLIVPLLTADRQRGGGSAGG